MRTRADTLAVRVRNWARAHPVLFVLLVAVAVRSLAAIVLTATVGMEKFPDTSGYNRLASDRASGAYHHWGAESSFFYDRLSGYVLPLAVLYRAFGDHLFYGQMLAAILGALTAGVICRLLLEISTVRWALLGGLVVALFPSQVVWSSVAYRDAAVWLAASSMALVAVWAGRARGWRLAICGTVLGGLMFWLAHLRVPTFIATGWALIVAALFSMPAGRLVRVLGALAIAILIPWYTGFGGFGADYARSYSPRDVRVERARGRTVLHEARETSDVAFAPRGLAVALFGPFPWTRYGGYEVRLTQAELLVWYPLLVVAAAGIPALVRRRREVAFVAMWLGTMTGVYALYESNLGTLLRHRSELVPGLAVFAALGAPVLAARWQQRRQRMAELKEPAQT